LPETLPITAADNNPGWNSGDKQSGSGAIGWHLTVNELLGAMATYRRRGTIVAAWRAQRMLEDGIGLDFDFRRDTRLGTLYAKGGWWRSDEGKVEQSNAFFCRAAWNWSCSQTLPYAIPTRTSWAMCRTPSTTASSCGSPASRRMCWGGLRRVVRGAGRRI